MSPLDQTTVERIHRLGGNKLLAELWEVYTTHTPERMAKLAGGIESGDYDRAERAAHSIRSASVSLGAVAVADLAGELESAAQRQDLEELRSRLPELESAMESLLDELRVGVQETGA